MFTCTRHLTTKLNKRPMGHIAHLRKQLILINTYGYIITLIKRRKNPLCLKKKPLFTFWEFNGSSFEETWIPFIQGCIVPSLVEISQMVLKKKILKFRQCIFAISLSSPLGKGLDTSFEHIWIPFTQGCFVPSLVKICPVILEKKSQIGKV